MNKNLSAQGRTVTATVLVLALSAVPYLTLFALDSALGVANAATAAIAPALVVPVVVLLALGVQLARTRSAAVVAHLPVHVQFGKASGHSRAHAA